MAVTEFNALTQEQRQFFVELRARGFARIVSFSPELLASLRLSPSAPPEILREHVRRRILSAAEQLDRPLGNLFLTVAGFRSDSPAAVSARLRAAADATGVSDRTVRRHYEQACVRLSVLIRSDSTRSALPDIDYVYRSSHTWIDLRDDEPTIVVTRTLSARSDHIGHVDDRIRLPRFDGDSLRVIGLEGCRVATPHLVGTRIWAMKLSFPRPVRVGEQHTFALSIRLPDRDSLEPFVGFLPHTTSLDATVDLLFGDRRPAMLERFAAPPPVDGLDRIPGSALIRPVETRHTFIFDQMQPGICCGVRWHWDDVNLTIT